VTDVHRFDPAVLGDELDHVDQRTTATRSGLALPGARGPATGTLSVAPQVDSHSAAQPATRAAAATVTVYPNGPLVLRGDFDLRDVDGTSIPTGRLVALCRCGRSAVKPLCDGSHSTGSGVTRGSKAQATIAN
jgi:CDGSH-type Zn-finger protein